MKGAARIATYLGRILMVVGFMLILIAWNGAANLDYIQDFSTRDDRIALENGVFRKLGKAGGLASKAFVKGPEALDASDRVIYDPTKGRHRRSRQGARRGPEERPCDERRRVPGDLEHRRF